MVKEEDQIVKLNTTILLEEALIDVGGLPTSIKVSNDNLVLYVCTKGG